MFAEISRNNNNDNSNNNNNTNNDHNNNNNMVVEVVVMVVVMVITPVTLIEPVTTIIKRFPVHDELSTWTTSLDCRKAQTFLFLSFISLLAFRGSEPYKVALMT